MVALHLTCWGLDLANYAGGVCLFVTFVVVFIMTLIVRRLEARDFTSITSIAWLDVPDTGWHVKHDVLAPACFRSP